MARGSRCLAIMRDLRSIRTSHLRRKLMALATISPSAACNKYAGETAIEQFENPTELLSIEYLNLIIELTGDQIIPTERISHKPPSIGVPGRQTAVFFSISPPFMMIRPKQ